MTYPHMPEKEVRSLFTLAGIEVLNMQALKDGYSYPADDPRALQEAPRCFWWFVKTKWGWIEIGWRKRVMSIDWSDTGVRGKVTEDATTQEDHMVHAWDTDNALKYLRQWNQLALFGAPTQHTK